MSKPAVHTVSSCVLVFCSLLALVPRPHFSFSFSMVNKIRITHRCTVFCISFVPALLLLPSWTDLDFIPSQRHKSCKLNLRVGLVSKISVSEWSYLSSPAIMSFFPLLQEKKRHLQPLLPHRSFLLSRGAERVYWGYKSDNKSPSYMSSIDTSRLVFAHMRGRKRQIDGGFERRGINK